MILINLLPHREAARKRQKDQFYTQLGLSALLGGIISGQFRGWRRHVSCGSCLSTLEYSSLA